MPTTVPTRRRVGTRRPLGRPGVCRPCADVPTFGPTSPWRCARTGFPLLPKVSGKVGTTAQSAATARNHRPCRCAVPSPESARVGTGRARGAGRGPLLASAPAHAIALHSMTAPTSRRGGAAKRARNLAEFFSDAAKALEDQATPEADAAKINETVNATWTTATGHEVRFVAAMMLVDAVALAADRLHDERYWDDYEVHELGTEPTPPAALFFQAVERGLSFFGAWWPEHADRVDRTAFAKAVQAWDQARERPTTDKWKATAAMLGPAGPKGLGLGRVQGQLTKPSTLKPKHNRWRQLGDTRTRDTLPWWPSSLVATLSREARAAAAAEGAPRSRQ